MARRDVRTEVTRGGKSSRTRRRLSHPRGPRRRGRDANCRDSERRHDESAPPTQAGGHAGVLQSLRLCPFCRVRPGGRSNCRKLLFRRLCPGGHGSWPTMAFDAYAGTAPPPGVQLTSGRPLFIVCLLVPAVPMSTTVCGVSPKVQGLPVTVFTNEEEEAVGAVEGQRGWLETELEGKDWCRLQPR